MNWTQLSRRQIYLLSVLTLTSGLALSTAAIARGRTPPEPARLAPSSAPGHLVLHVGLLDPAGLTDTAVPLNHEFGSSERFRIRLSASRDGYIFLLKREPDGMLHKLWPAEGGASAITGRETVLVPPDGYFRLDEQLGGEKVRIVFSLSPVDDALVLRAGKEVANQDIAPRIRQIRLRGAADRSALDAEFSGDIVESGVAVVDLDLVHRARR